eukprot:c19340_g1_i1 orf=52-1938(-)
MVTKKPRIVIVGAGMAGLAAAYQLQRLSCADNSCFDLIVLEASQRIGGRICTAKFGGDQLELGATWIHGIGGSPVYDIVRKVGALKGNTPWERQDGLPRKALVKAEGGLTIDHGIMEPIVNMYKKLMSELRHKGVSDKSDCKNRSVGVFLRDSLNDFMSKQANITEIERSILSSKKLHHNNQLCCIDSFGWNWRSLQDGIFSMHEFMERVLTAASTLSDLDLAAEKEYQEYSGEHITIGKGYVSVLNYLASCLPFGTIQFGKKVEKFVWSPTQPSSIAPVALYCEDGSVIEADHVIITVSLGVLKAGTLRDCLCVSVPGKLAGSGAKGRHASRPVHDFAMAIANGNESHQLFQPPLPSWKTEAISRLGFGVVNKLFLQLDPEVEEPLRSHLQLVYKQEPPMSDNIPWWFRKTFSLCPVYDGSSTLLAWFAGDEALHMESLSDEAIVSGVVNTLSEFGIEHRSSLTRNEPREGMPSAEKDCSSDSPVHSQESCPKRQPKTGTTSRLPTMFKAILHSSWGRDPLFRGSYSYVAVGSSGQDFDTMAEPLPKCHSLLTAPPPPPLQLLFAGEATDRHFYSTTHGAYHSGIREANRLLHHYGLSHVDPLLASECCCCSSDLSSDDDVLVDLLG